MEDEPISETERALLEQLAAERGMTPEEILALGKDIEAKAIEMTLVTVKALHQTGQARILSNIETVVFAAAMSVSAVLMAQEMVQEATANKESGEPITIDPEQIFGLMFQRASALAFKSQGILNDQAAVHGREKFGYI